MLHKRVGRKAGEAGRQAFKGTVGRNLEDPETKRRRQGESCVVKGSIGIALQKVRSEQAGKVQAGMCRLSGEGVGEVVVVQ